MRVVEAKGAVPYIDFKVNASDKGKCEVWNRMYHFYQYNRAAFLEFYHKRSNVESTFSMIKAKFGGFVRAKHPTAQINEVLCKILCHNLCVVIQSMSELGIEATFWNQAA
jgi:transposase